MTQSTISPLRQRMIDDMTLRRLSDKTQAAYLRAVIKLVEYLKRTPDTATAEDLRAFQHYLVEQGTSPQTINATLRGLSFFFDITLDRPQVLKRVSRVRVPEKLPFVLSQQAVVRLLNAAPTIKARTALSVAYGTGLRAAEITHIKLTDIDSQRMIIRVDQGKGSRDRQAMLSPTLLALLRDWWRAANKVGKMLPNGWLFPGMNPVNPISPRQLNRYCKTAAKAANLDKRVSMHTLRHCYATHLLDDKVDIRVIQVLLGHKKLDTTARYTRVAARVLHDVKSPLDQVQRPIT